MKKDRKGEEERVKIDDCHSLSLKYARTLAVLCTETKEHTTPYINCGDTLPKIVTATCQIMALLKLYSSCKGMQNKEDKIKN